MVHDTGLGRLARQVLPSTDNWVMLAKLHDNVTIAKPLFLVYEAGIKMALTSQGYREGLHTRNKTPGLVSERLVSTTSCQPG